MSSLPQTPVTEPLQRQVPAEYQDFPADHQLNLLLPDSFYRPLWKSLFVNLRDRILPEKLPPLQITSRPVEVGMLIGDILALPWYRTVFTNLGDMIAPEILQPLQLESRPVDVGELISDQMSHFWWTSLLRNLADAIAPERQSALQLTSTPVNPGLPSDTLELPRWSSLISAPKISLPDKPKSAYVTPQSIVARVLPSSPTQVQVDADPSHAHAINLRHRLSRSRLREAFLISVASLEALYLLAVYFGR